jgi:hypothetical protein
MSCWRPSAERLAAAIAILAAALAAGCGETTFDAPGFVEEANSHGAGLHLGEQLLSTDPEREVFAVELTAAVAASGHGGGSLAITDGDDAALAEFRRCESAVTLLCYRAANVVLLFESEIPAEGLARVEGAIRAMGEG